MLSLWANWLQLNSQLNSTGVSFWLYRMYKSLWENSRGHPDNVSFMQFCTKIYGFEQKDSPGIENSYNSYEQYPLEKFFIFTIYSGAGVQLDTPDAGKLVWTRPDASARVDKSALVQTRTAFWTRIRTRVHAFTRVYSSQEYRRGFVFSMTIHKKWMLPSRD